MINLQKSPWGGESFYLNLGWDPAVASGEFRSENSCVFGLRAENIDVIPSIDFVRPDGLAARDLPGIILLDAEMSSRIPEDSFVKQLIDVIVVPIADFMDRTPALQDLVPLLTEKPHLAFIPVREELKRRGFTLPAM
ncbi:hypothetical protein AS031_17645 [Pseudarthrobacter enclensis]|uniref:Uncharacterized protein n=1 Tax=Pseudarthrobacter enclensis TaxID=993070 RepID=A0A0V8I7Q6_9MICC|nr:hypothetical protein AS031_17645 [Pseudarthrobacter enclensis]